MKESNPGVWWKEVKRLCGSQSFTDDCVNKTQVEGVENLSMEELVNTINKAFLKPLEEYWLLHLLNRLPLDKQSTVFLKCMPTT